VAQLIQEIEKAGKDAIRVSPHPIRARQSAKVVLDKAPSEPADLLRAIVFQWEFFRGDTFQFHGSGASVSCYFAAGGKWTIQLHATAKFDQSVKASACKPISVGVVRDRRIGPRGWTEMARILGTQLLTGVAAVATTADKIASANFVLAVFAAIAAGYAADTLKNAGAALVSKLTPTTTRAQATSDMNGILAKLNQVPNR